MNAPLRRVGVVVLVLFGLLFANLNYVQAYKADDYRTNEHNGRVQLSEYERERGTISLLPASGGVVLAKSVATTDELKYLRTYPGGPAYAHILGYKPVNNAATGVERIENDFLSGNADSLLAERLAEMFTGKKKPGGSVVLTLSKAAQETAYNDLVHNRVGAKVGAAVAIDPKTGALLAAASVPSFDPNPLASHDTQAALDAFERLDKDPAKPLLNRAFSELYPPGSTMKVIDSAAALANGLTEDSVITGGASYTAPGTTHVISNAPGVVCPDQITLKQALTVSCNTAFSRLGVEQLGADKFKSMAQAFGFETAPTIDQDDKNVYHVAASHTGAIEGPDGQEDKPILAQSCIGQAEVRMSPLQGALIAATVANGGSQMRPYLIDKLQAPDLSVTYQASPQESRHPVSAEVAAQLRDMMISVVENGTGRRARISGFQVGGKTGTAENGEQAADHGWFIGFVSKDDDPIAAVAVFLEHAGPGGSAEAARIAGEVMKAIINERGLK